MIRRPPRSTRTDTLFPYTTLFRSKDAVEDLGAKFERTPIGTGPFMFAEYQPQQFVKLVANDAYFRGAPKIKEIYYRYIPSDASRDLAFQSGEIDMIYGKQDQTWVERISTIPNTKVMVMATGEQTVIHLKIIKQPTKAEAQVSKKRG